MGGDVNRPIGDKLDDLTTNTTPSYYISHYPNPKITITLNISSKIHPENHPLR